LVSVPRIYEKIYSRIISEVQSQPDLKKSIFQWSINVGRECARLKSQKALIPLPLFLKQRVAEKLVFSKIRRKLGGKIRMTLSGGAPLSPELCEIFHACGVKIMEAYGLTETTAAITVNRPNDYCFATVGKPLGGTEIRIAEDGEILLRGPMIFKEYYNNAQATKEVFTEDGWFRTGDVGEINDRGFLRITDRKKEIIVTSGGKNVAPQKLENLLKNSLYISNVMIIGDKQKYIAAVICLNETEIKTFAKQKQIAFEEYADLIANDQVKKLVDEEVKKVNAQLASYESIKRFALLPADFTTETGELTPSLKVKRKVVSAKYKSTIDGLFS
jgi:long-chain acyl-CoA synthetase